MRITWKQGKRYEPSVTLLIGFGAVSLLGCILLMLPFAAQSGEATPFVDALFTATSAVCVTGQVVVNTFHHWTSFGKAVIITLIQVGGLGFVTFVTGFFLLIKKRVTLKDRLAIQASFNRERLDGLVKLVRSVALGTLLLEGVGGVILSVRFLLEPGERIGSALAKGFFHAISAFCNAGFDIIGEESLARYVGDPVVNIVIMALIVSGGIGFSVWFELVSRLRDIRARGAHNGGAHASRLSIHAKMALLYTAALILGGALFFLMAEYRNPQTLGALPLGGKVFASFFQSVTTRTAGFYTIDQAGMTLGSKLMTAMLMFIGGSPGGTAGGIKTVTLAVLVFSSVSILRGKRDIEAFGRSIPFSILQKALAMTTMMLVLLVVSTMVLTFSESASPFPHDLADLLIETSSVLGTVGLSTGITPHLSPLGKCTLIACMFVGRTGPITVAIGMTMRLAHSEHSVRFPEERVFVG